MLNPNITCDKIKATAMISETGLDSVLPGILVENNSDWDDMAEQTDDETILIETSCIHHSLQIKLEVPDSCSEGFVMVNIILFEQFEQL